MARTVGIVVDHQHACVRHRSLGSLVRICKLWDAIGVPSIRAGRGSYRAIHSDAELKGREYVGCLECRPSTTPETPAQRERKDERSDTVPRSWKPPAGRRAGCHGPRQAQLCAAGVGARLVGLQ